MPTKQSSAFKGNARTPIATSHKAGDAHTYLFTHTFTEAVLTTDVLEIFPIFPNGKVVAIDFATENVGAINVGIGLMSGVSGDASSVRTCGTEFFAAAAANTPAAAALITLAAVARADDVKSIGLVPAADITAAANKKIHLRITVVG